MMTKNKTITMKKGTATINVDAARQKYYERQGYVLLTRQSSTRRNQPKSD